MPVPAISGSIAVLDVLDAVAELMRLADNGHQPHEPTAISRAGRWLNVNEVAARVGMHPVTIRRLLRDGELPGRKVGSQWRVAVDDLNDWMSTTPR